MLAIFLHCDINLKTSKHSGVLAIFDKELVHSGRLEKRYSKIAHRLFDVRQQVDYKELIEVSEEEARECIMMATEFGQAARQFIENP